MNDSESPTEELTMLISKYSLIPLLAGLLIRFVQGSKSGIVLPFLFFVILLQLIFVPSFSLLATLLATLKTISPLNQRGNMAVSTHFTQTYLYLYLEKLPHSHISGVSFCVASSSYVAMVADVEEVVFCPEVRSCF